MPAPHEPRQHRSDGAGAVRASRPAGALVVLFIFLLPGCVTISPREEVDLGRDYARELNRELPLIQRSEVRGYLEEEGLAIARRTPRPDLPYELQVVNADAVNAFAVPGGFLYMNRGLIQESGSMAEVAGVLSHEIAHVVARHSVKQLEAAQRAQLAVGLGSILLGPPRGAAGAAVNVGANLYFAKHSRRDEAEADSLAVGFMLESGWDPRAMISFFETLLELREDRPGALEALFASHPVTEARIGNLRRIIGRIPGEQLRGLRTTSEGYATMVRTLEGMPPPPEKYRTRG